MGRIRVAVLACLALVLLAVVPAAHAQSPQPRVVGGETTTIEEYPWQAAVVTVGPGTAFDRQFCGGSLITSRIVLTAAHCVYDTDPDCDPDCPNSDEDGTPRIDPNDVEVVLGRTTLSSSEGVEHDVLDVAFQGDDGTPPVYNPSFGSPVVGVPQNDVGYLVLDSAVPTTETPVLIAGPGEEALWAPDVFVEITGWGSTFFGGSTVDTLRAGSVPMVADSTCDDDYGVFFDQASMVCAGYTNGGVDTCRGDSGGPLESALMGGGYRLVGITSWGEGCAEPNFPGVYTRVGETALRDAIRLTVSGLETEHMLAPENIVGTGGVSAGGGPKYPPPPPPPPPQSAPTTAAPTAAAPSDPFAKCRKVRNKKKRKRCTKKVRARLGL